MRGGLQIEITNPTAEKSAVETWFFDVINFYRTAIKAYKNFA